VTTYKVTFLPLNVTVEVDPAKFPLQEDGLPGSILDIALGNNIDCSTTAAASAPARLAT